MAGKLFGAAATYAAQLFKGDMTEEESSQLVGTSAIQILPNDPERVNMVAINLSGNTIFVAFDNNVSSDNGILLGPNGGSMSLNVNDDITLPTRGLWAVATGANSRLYTIGVRRFTGLGGSDAD